MPPGIRWWDRSSGRESLFEISVNINKTAFDGTNVHLTDAKHCGVMLREKRLTLRSHSAITTLRIEAVTDTDYILQAVEVEDDNNYLRVGDKKAFFATASKNDAAKFQLKVTGLGIELYLEGQRPAVFDDYYDVSIGEWHSGLSTIPILVFSSVDEIWTTAGTSTAGSGPSLSAEASAGRNRTLPVWLD